ncbi:hypothetical protein NDN08_001902 [Rhodosorus marinus]|uniref:EF-hand domain-containing protein n=1 Tax=Rhodosorus marinus TaxID=101924 RepID=A0AAV8US54_9RHOD|nr:hypothetical protein NDN08_001902 [Rhodosorus marinus]
MGANTSSLLSEEIEEIARESNLSARDIKSLYKRFQKLDRSKSGVLSADDLTMIPELAMNPLVPRVTALLHNTNFRQFVNFLGVLSPNAQKSAKIDFAYRIYDVDGDGVINASDLQTILRMMVGDNLKDETLDEITEMIISNADLDGDKVINRSEFETALNTEDVVNLMTVSTF